MPQRKKGFVKHAFNLPENDTDPGACQDGSIWVNLTNKLFRICFSETKYNIPHGGFHRCSVTKSADQSIGDQSWTSITFNQEDYDVGGMHDNSTNNSRLTIIDAGEYRICYHVKHDAKDKKAYETRIRKNGDTVIDGTCDVTTGSKDSSYLTLKSTSCCITFNANDYIELQFWHDAGINQNVLTSNTFFAIERVW